MHIYKSPEEIKIPTSLNLTELLHASPLPPSHLIATDNLTNRSLTLGKLRENAGTLASGLVKKLSPTDQARWAIILPNSVDFLEIVHAILWTGGVVCPINHALKPAEMAHGLGVTRPDYIIAYGEVLASVEEAVAISGISPPKEIITIITRPKTKTKTTTKLLLHIPTSFLSSKNQTQLPIPHYNDTKTRLATIHLSSGTTGHPKGVQLTHFNFVSNCHQLLHRDPEIFSPGSRCVAFTPWTHIGNTTVPLFLAPWTGMFIHAMPAYDFPEYVSLISSTRATFFQGVPSVVLQLANADETLYEKHDFSQAKVINVGGHLPAAITTKLLSRAPWRLNQVYGMTEAAGYVAYQRYGEILPDDRSTGRLLPGIEACLKRENTVEDAPIGGPGELWIRGPNITPGYAFNEEANAKAFPLGGGWYNTGDVCMIDSSRGFVSVVGRTKDLIKYKGFQVSPAEIEALVNAHPHVVEGGVGATWDEGQLTELPTAWVVLKEDSFKTVEEQRRALRDIHRDVDREVSGYKKLRGGVWQVDHLPKNPTGKIVRKELVEMRDGPCSLDEANKAKL
ncbi:AMP-binding enzyme [Poronia punctata]|nr:AMP-binding enzyme [Poronia punctata]